MVEVTEAAVSRAGGMVEVTMVVKMVGGVPVALGVDTWVSAEMRAVMKAGAGTRQGRTSQCYQRSRCRQRSGCDPPPTG